MFEWDTWVCGESWLTVKNLTHHPSSQGWAPRCPSHCAFHVCIVLVWCIGSGFSFFSPFTTNLHVASVLCTCIFIHTLYIYTCTCIRTRTHTVLREPRFSLAHDYIISVKVCLCSQSLPGYAPRKILTGVKGHHGQ